MAGSFCPQCGNQRTGSLRFCSQCGFDFWQVATRSAAPSQERPTVRPEPTSAPAAPAELRARPAVGTLGKVVLGLIVLAVLAGVYAVVSNGGIGLGGGTSKADVPPVGQIWFGQSFDPSTMAMSGRTTSVGAQTAFSMVAHLPKSMDGSQLDVRAYLNGDLITTQAANAKGSGDLWGWSAGPLFQTGTWRYEITDLGGNVLASGEVTATGQ
jgi:hypothetical protein